MTPDYLQHATETIGEPARYLQHATATIGEPARYLQHATETIGEPARLLGVTGALSNHVEDPTEAIGEPARYLQHATETIGEPARLLGVTGALANQVEDPTEAIGEPARRYLQHATATIGEPARLLGVMGALSNQVEDPTEAIGEPARLLGVVVVMALASACEAGLAPEAEPPPLVVAELEVGYPVLTGPCVGPVAEPTHLVVTSTDFNTGAVGLVEIATREVAADLAPASSDAVPVVVDGRVFVLNRFGFDYVDELDPTDALALIDEFPIVPATTDGSANPQGFALDPDGRGWISLLEAGELQRVRFPSSGVDAASVDLAVDLREFADADGIPELSAVIGCGAQLFVAAERVDRERWVPADETLLIPVHAGAEPKLHEFDPEHPGADAIHLLGAGIGDWRVDPSEPSGHVIVALSSGLERIDLAAGTSAWLVSDTQFVAAGYQRLQLASFDWDADGTLWVSAAVEDFSSYRLIRVELGGAEPELVVAVEGLASVTGAMEIVGHEAWFADTTIGASGLRVFDLADDPVVELPESPLAVGLPPMSLAPR